MIRTSRRLADGREILYYDQDGSPASHEAVDARDLPAVGSRSTLRWDALPGEWVAYAAHRQTRTYLPPADQCPLCPTRPGRPATEVPERGYQVVVLENRFPSLATAVDPVVPAAAPGAPHAELRPGLGRCEVVVFTSDHDRAPADLPPERLRLVVDVWADRTEALAAVDGVEHVFVFENHGEAIGVTLTHPHGQIYGYSYLPPQVGRVLASVERRRAQGGDLFAEVVAAERAGPRVVAANAHWTAFVPAAARWPYELHLVPHRRVPDLPALGGEERDALAELYRDVLGRFAHRFDEPMNYVSAWHQAPVRRGREEWWLYLQLFSLQRAPGALKYLAGSESAMGAFISDTDPEDVAEQLRNTRW